VYATFEPSGETATCDGVPPMNWPAESVVSGGSKLDSTSPFWRIRTMSVPRRATIVPSSAWLGEP
jgi:hypothetical protein